MLESDPQTHFQHGNLCQSVRKFPLALDAFEFIKHVLYVGKLWRDVKPREDRKSLLEKNLIMVTEAKANKQCWMGSHGLGQ